MMRRLIGVLGLAVSFAALGCGGDGDSATQIACNAYCDAYLAKSCPSPFPSRCMK